MSKYERIAGTEDAMILREALEKLSEGSLSSSLEGKVDVLIKELTEARIQRDRELDLLERSLGEKVDIDALVTKIASINKDSLDVESLVAKIYNLTNDKPSYKFTIERNYNGTLVGITATPEV